MPRICTVCSHAKHSEIDALLLSNEPYRNISKRFNLSQSAVFRHLSDHLAAHLAKAKELQEAESSSDLVRRLREIHAETKAVLERAKKSKDWATALRAITRLESQISLEAELLGQLERGRPGETHIEVHYVDKAVIVGGSAPKSPAALNVGAAAQE